MVLGVMGGEINMPKRWMRLWVHHLGVESPLVKPGVVVGHLPVIRLKKVVLAYSAVVA